MRVETSGKGRGVTGTGDASLLEDLRRGSRSAAAEVVQRHNRGLWRIARGILGNDSDAEEAVQDAYVRAFSSLDAFRGDASLGTWLARIVINEALRRVERRKPTVDLADVAEQLPADHAGSATMAAPLGPEHAAARAEIQRILEHAVDALPSEFRAVFMMRVVEQMSIEETAGLLGIPQATVKTRLHRANERLRTTLGVEFAAILEGTFPFGGARCERMTQAVLARLVRSETAVDPPSRPTTPAT
jgi:RNA polymerase sigma-70 factor, ECF subfamily